MNSVILKSGIIVNDEKWDGNIVIIDDVVIPKGVTVVVSPNTKIKFKKQSQNKLFNKNYKLDYLIKKFNLPKENYVAKVSVIVYGTLLFDGKKENLINVGNDGWNGIIYAAPSSKIKFKYTRIRYGFGIMCDVNAQTMVVDSCIIEQCCLGIVAFSKILIMRSRINYNDIGILCFSRFIVDDNYVSDNFICGIKILSKQGRFSKNYVALNNIGSDVFKASNIKLYYNIYEFNNTGVLINSSHNIFCNGTLINNFINIYVHNYSYDITIVSYIMLYIGIYVDNLSEVKIKNSLMSETDLLLYSSNYSTIDIENTGISNVLVAVLAIKSCNVLARKVQMSDIGKCFIVLQTNVFGEENTFRSEKEVFTNLESNIYLKKSKIESEGLLCMTNGHSDIFLNDVQMKSASLFHVYEKAKLNLYGVFATATEKGLFSRQDTKIFVAKSKITTNDQIFELVHNSKVQIEDCTLTSKKSSFASIVDKSILQVENNEIRTFDSFCDIRDHAKLYVKASLIKNTHGNLIYAKNYSLVKIEGSKIKSFFGIETYDDAEIELVKNNIFILRTFASAYLSSLIVLKNNDVKLDHSTLQSFGLSKIKLQFDNKFFIRKLGIEINDHSDINFSGSQFTAVYDIFVEYKKEIDSLKNIFVKAKDIFVIMRKNKSFYLIDSKIDARLILNTNSDTVNICNSVVKNWLFLNKKNLIKITDSEITDMLEAKDTEDIDIDNSKLNNIRINNNSYVKIKRSEIKGDFINVREEGELSLDRTKIILARQMEEKQNGKLKIKRSKIYSIGGIKKTGEESLEIIDSEITSETIGLLIENGDVEILDSKIEGKIGLEMSDKGKLGQMGLVIESKKEGLIYNGEEIEINGIKISSETDAIKSKCKYIEILNSDIKGNIECAKFSHAIVKRSKICGRIKNMGVTEIECSDITGEEMTIESDIVIKDSNIENQIINIRNGGNTYIENSTISTVEGINKDSCYDLICNNSNIFSDNTCFNSIRKSKNKFNNVCFNSKENYSVTAENTNLELNNSKIMSKKGFLCKYKTSCEIKNVDANVFFNFCNINKSNFYVDGLKLCIVIPKECFYIDNSSEINLKNIDIEYNNSSVYSQFLDEKPITYLLGDSKLFVESLKFSIQAQNKMCFLRTAGRTFFDLQNIDLSGLYNFLYMGTFSTGYLYNSKIKTNAVMFYMCQNSKLNILNTELENLACFKFVSEDNSNLSLKNVNIHNGQLITMSQYSQIHIDESSIKINGYACKVQDNAYFIVKSSDWQIGGNVEKKYAFCLLNKAKVNVSSSNISTKESFLYCIDDSYLKIENTNIFSDTMDSLFLFSDNTKTEIMNSKLNVYSLATLKNHAYVILKNSSIKAKDFIIKLAGNSKVFIKGVLFKQISNNKKIAFEVLHNSKINITDSIVDNFYVGIKYENRKNINIENTDINSNKKIIFTNDKRYLTVANPIRKNLLYKVQQFVLSTNNVFPLNKIYNFIYVISIIIYRIFTDKNCIQALYLRRGMLNNWIAGSSDIDYLSILKQTDVNTEYKNIINIKRRYKELKKLFPFYGENLIFNEKELEFYLKYGGIRSKLLKNSKLLRGKQQNLKTDVVVDLKYKIDIVKEILNSYILLSNNYFYNIDIISDICFSKASTDILKYIDYFYDMKDLDKSRIKYLSDNNDSDVKNKLYGVLKNNVCLNDDDRNYIYNYIFNKLELLSIDFNKEIILNNDVKKIIIRKKDSIDLFEELASYKNYILSVVLEDPGLAYIVINSSTNAKEIFPIYKKAKQNYCFYNTPILFFTENMYQMLLLSNFRNNPFEFCKQCNVSDKYYNRRFYISKNYRYYYQNAEILKKLIISSLAEKSLQINEIEITKKFDEIKIDLYEVLVDIIQFYLYFKNDKIIKEFSSTNIVDEYKKQDRNFEKEILFLFEDNCRLKDEERIQRIIFLMKKLKNEIMKNYE